MPLRHNYCTMRRFHIGVCSSRRIKVTLIFDIFEDFSYRSSDRLQRRNAKSTQSIRAQTFAASEPVSYRAVLCPAISCQDCSFMPCHLVRHFYVLLFHPLQNGPSISRPAFSLFQRPRYPDSYEIVVARRPQVPDG